jgi:hypothetical protein
MKNSSPQLISYMNLRKAIGVLGLSLPGLLLIGSLLFGECKEIQSSLSAYYYTNMRDVFVGVLAAVGLFLYAYKGYEKQDNIVSNLGAIFALGVAFFPTSIKSSISSCINVPIDTGFTNILHLFFAASFLLILAFFCMVLFTKSFGVPTNRKRLRNIVYRICGICILVCLFAMGLSFLLENKLPFIRELKVVFWLESIALWAFGISWLTKGQAILSDFNKN